MIAGVPYDAEIAWLESTGTQYIDTGIVVSSNTKVVVQSSADTTTSGYIVMAVANSTYFGLQYYRGIGLRVFCGQASYSYLQQDFVADKVYDYAIDNNTTEISIDGTIVKTTTRTGGVGGSLFLFGYDGSNATCKIWSIKVYEGSILIHDLIPVRKGQTGYMYDRVSRKLFGNAGTGSFTLGPDVATPVMGIRKYADGIMLPPGARWVEYLESTGTQYIDTGMIPSATCKFIDDSWHAFQTAFGSLNSGSQRFHAYFPFCVRHEYLGAEIRYPYTKRTVVTLDTKHGTFDFDDTHITFAAGLDPMAPSFCLFARNFAGVIDSFENGCKLYGFDWWDDADSDISLKLRPIAIGNMGYMLDLVSGEYLPYGNQGTGDFGIGPDAPAPTI